MCVFVCVCMRVGLCVCVFVGKKSKYVFDLFSTSEKQGFPFSYAKVEHQERLYGPLDETHVQTNIENSLSNGANQSALRQILFEL